MFISTAFAQGAGAPAGGGMLEMFLPLVLIFVIFYLLLIRPQQKRQKEHQAKLAAARRGDDVVLGGGMMAKVTKVVDDNELEVEIAAGVKVRVLKSTLMDILTKTEPAKDTPSAANSDSNGGKKGGLFGGLFGGKK